MLPGGKGGGPGGSPPPPCGAPALGGMANEGGIAGGIVPGGGTGGKTGGMPAESTQKDVGVTLLTPFIASLKLLCR